MNMTNILVEGAIFHRPENVKKYTDGKVIFDAYLQEADNRNKNRRIYPRDVLDNGMERISGKIKSRSFLGELDHPITDDPIRQSTVHYKEASHIIREWGWDGDMIKGVVETTPYSVNGKNLSGLVLDRVTVGFSLRGMGDVVKENNSIIVQDPLIIVTYDCVSEPSHAGAVIKEIRQEQYVQIIRESKTLIECNTGKCYLPNLFDELVERRILTIKERYS